jgi:hypothetical protein
MPRPRLTVPDIEDFVPDTHRYPFAPLEALLPPRPPFGPRPGEDYWKTVLKVTTGHVSAFRKRGLNWQQADDLAIRIGLHPSLIWPDWFERGLFGGE